MSADDDIRRTLRSEATRYDPADDGWDAITGRVAAARRRRRVEGGVLGGLAAACLAVVVGIAVTGGDGTDVDATDATVLADDGGTATSDTTSTPTSAPTTSSPATAATFPGIWPFASEGALAGDHGADARFTDPATTAEAFAREYVGMLDPAVGAREPGPGGAVTVELRPRGEDGEPLPAGGPSTVVTLRPYETPDGTEVWTVVGAASPHVVVDEPAAGEEVASPLAVRGEATGYEGTVVAEVRADGTPAGVSLGQAVGIAGSMGEMGPLDLDVTFTSPPPGTGAGALLVTTDTGLDGVGVFEATVVRVTFGPPGSGPDAAPAADCEIPPPAGEPGPAEMDVTIWLVCAGAAGADPAVEDTFVPVVRRVERDPAVLGAAMGAFLGGTTVEEEDVHGVSAFTYHPVTTVDVTMKGSRAIVDFSPELTSDATSASSATGSMLFRGALSRTAFQFATVDEVEYRLGGSCEAFWEWQQVGGCPIVTRDDL